MSSLQYYRRKLDTPHIEYFLFFCEHTIYLLRLTQVQSSYYLQGKIYLSSIEDDVYIPWITKEKEEALSRLKTILAKKIGLQYSSSPLICDEDELTNTDYTYLYFLLDYNEFSWI